MAALGLVIAIGFIVVLFVVVAVLSRLVFRGSIW